MPTYTQYKDATDTTVGPSPIIWADCPTLEMMHDPGVGIHHFDNFQVSDIVDGSGYQGLGDVVPAYATDSLNGRVVLTPTGTDNHQTMLGTTVDLAHISDAAGEAAKLWFECRVNVSSIADMGLFVGLAAEADMAVDFLANNTAELVATADCIGFKVLTASPTAVGTVYQKGSATRQDVETGVHTLVADTYVKLGFVYDPAEEAGKQIRYYVNGAETATSVTATNIAAATFPDSVNMGLLATIKTGEGVAKTLTLDWWRVAQLLPRE